MLLPGLCLCSSWPRTMPGAVPTASSCSRAASSSACGPCRMCSYCTSRGSARYCTQKRRQCCSNVSPAWTLPVFLTRVGKARFVLTRVLSSAGGRPEGEDAEHGEVPVAGDGHGAPHGQEEPEQLEPTFPLVAVETTLRPGTQPGRLLV